MNIFKTILFIVSTLGIIISCEEKEMDIDVTILSEYLATKKSVAEDVIACAATSKNEQSILVYFFPETDTDNYKLYTLSNSEFEKTDFEHYKLQSKDSEIAVANTIRSFELDISEEETWAIVSFEKNNQISYSNAINLKHKKSPTIFNSDITIDNSTLNFSWTNTLGIDNTENAIYFEIISNHNNDLISGTYTYENQYTYLDNTNVVLTITPNNTQELTTNTNYNFAVMGVSEDNWVNFIAEKDFISNKF